MSPIWPSPPPLTTTDNADSVCSVDGYVEVWFRPSVAPGCKPPAGRLTQRRIEGQVHRAQQAGLAHRRHRVGGDHPRRASPTSRRRRASRVTVILPTLPTTTSPTRTGEFDSSVADIGDLDVVGGRARAAADRAGQRQRVQATEGAAADAERDARRDRPPPGAPNHDAIMMAVSLRRVAVAGGGRFGGQQHALQRTTAAAPAGADRHARAESARPGTAPADGSAGSPLGA